MQALEELPNTDKDLLIPFIPFGPWTTAQNFSSSLSRVQEAYGDRPYFVTLAEPEIGGASRPVHATVAALCNPENGFRAWCEFIERHSNFIPNVQIAAPASFDLPELAKQTGYLYGLGRGIIVAFPRRQFQVIDLVSKQVSALTNGGHDVCFFIDLGKLTEATNTSGVAKEHVEKVLQNAPNSFVSISASSFPENFNGRVKQEILERIVFNLVSVEFRSNIIYSDRGSARAEKLMGGGAGFFPRVDYAASKEWLFFRSDEAASNNDTKSMHM